MSLVRGLIQPGLSAVKKAPFYSAVDEALAAIKRPKGTGAEFYTELTKQPGVKKAELADRKLEQAFKAKGKITKEEAQQVLADNPPPKVQERILEDIDGDERRRLLGDKMEIYGYDNYREVPHRVLREWNAEIDAEAAKYADDDYRTQGGSNYREMLLKLPQSYTEKDFHRLLMLEAEQRRGDLTPEQLKEITELQAKKQTAASNYQSGHWDDANVLAHMRVQDRLIAQPPQKGFYVVNKTSGRQSAMFDTPEELQAYVETLPESIRNNVTMAQGERKVPPRKVLQVEEIQSDWHQAGRKKGYQGKNLTPDEIDLKYVPPNVPEGHDPSVYPGYYEAFNKSTGEFVGRHSGSLSQEQAMRDAVSSANQFKTGVPDAPFKKNWHELAMKRLLNYAAEKGYDGIAITPGAEHFKRYGSERIDWKKGDDGWIVGAKEQTGGRHEGRDLEEIARDRGILLERSGDQVKSKEDLHRIVNTVLNRENNPDQVNKLTNRIWDRMQTEAEGTSLPRKEGMEGFYDKMLTDYLNSYGRDYGAQVQMRQVAATPEAMEKKFNLNPNNLPDMNAEQASDYGKILQGFGNTQLSDVHYFPITQPMRESIKQKGLPLYQQVGIPTVGTGAASQMVEQKAPEQEEPEYSKGGSIAKQAALAKLKQMRGEMAPRAEAVKNIIARDQNSYLRDVVPNSLTNPEIEAEIQRMAARARASGQQEGVLPRAERDANLAKMLEQSEIQNRLYHGTTDDVPRFDPNMAGKKTGNLTTALGTFLSDNPAESSRYAELWGTEGGNVMPVFAQLKNPYVMPYSEYNKLAMGAWNRRMKDPDYDPNQIIKFGDIEAQKRASEALKKHEEAGLQDVIKRRNELIEQGHDSIVINIGGNREIIVFDPKKIKSATGNRGTYDINDPDVNKAKGGSVKPQVKKAVNGEVKITNNRDTMFMELSNKKLKRK